MNDIAALKRLILRYGFAAPGELEEALARIEPGDDPLARLVESGLINEKQAEVLARRLTAASAPQAPAAKPEPVKSDTGEIVSRPPEPEAETLEAISPARRRRRPAGRRRRPPAPEEMVPEPEPLPSEDELKGYPIGEVLLRLKLIDEETLAEALAAQEAAAALGTKEFIGSILLRNGAITAGELLKVLHIQGKKVLRCSTCDMHANLTPTAGGSGRFICPACFGSLREAAEDALFFDRFPPQIELDDRKPDPLVGREFKDVVIESLYLRTHSVRFYVGLQSSLGRKVALAVLEDELARRPEVRERFLQRARSVARLTFHGLAAGIDIGEMEGKPCYVFEFPEGHSLEAFVAVRGPLEPKIAADFALKAGEVFLQCHKHGIFPGCVAPEQVFIGPGFKPTFLGIGLDVPARTSGGVPFPAGNPAWTAPERFLGSPTDARSDIFVLGCLLYFALTGVAPMRGRNWPDLVAGRLSLDPQPVETIAENLPAKLPPFLASMMERDPASRAASFEGALESLAALAGESYSVPLEPDEPEVPKPISRPRTRRRPTRRRRP